MFELMLKFEELFGGNLLIEFIFLILAALLLYVLIKKLFRRYVLTTNKKRQGWEWIKGCIYITLSLVLIYGTFHRWYYFHDELPYSGNKKQLNPEYASQVELETYLMSQQNLIDLFEGKSPSPDMEFMDKDKNIAANDVPSNPRYFLVVRVKNKGDQVIWGMVDCSVEDREKRKADIPPLPPKMDEFKNIVVFAYDRNIPGPYPQIRTDWYKLYTSGEKK